MFFSNSFQKYTFFFFISLSAKGFGNYSESFSRAKNFYKIGYLGSDYPTEAMTTIDERDMFAITVSRDQTHSFTCGIHAVEKCLRAMGTIFSSMQEDSPELSSEKESRELQNKSASFLKIVGFYNQYAWISGTVGATPYYLAQFANAHSIGSFNYLSPGSSKRVREIIEE